MVKKSVLFLVVGLLLMALGLVLARRTGVIIWALLLTVGMCLVALWIASRGPKTTCHVCGHQFVRTRYQIADTRGSMPTLRCPRCGAIIPLR